VASRTARRRGELLVIVWFTSPLTESNGHEER